MVILSCVVKISKWNEPNCNSIFASARQAYAFLRRREEMGVVQKLPAGRPCLTLKYTLQGWPAGFCCGFDVVTLIRQQMVWASPYTLL